MAQTEEDGHAPDSIASDREVLQLVDTLTPLQQKICCALMDGLSIYQIARNTGRHYATICRHVEHIRQAFADRGFDTWSA